MRKLRPYRLYSTTVSLCANCLASVPAKVVISDGQVFLHKRCPAHGFQEELLEEDADWYVRRLDFEKPGTEIRPNTAVSPAGCPRDCGLCPDHEQHTCIALLEVTGACDLRCPTCFADAGSGTPLPLSTIDGMLDACLRAEGGQTDVLQVSGGEPTTHPDIVAILQHALDRPFRWVMLNTNGVRIAEDDALVDALAAIKGRLEIYLQFDGLDDRVHRALRGRPLQAIKDRALARLAAREIPVTLVATVAEAVNDDAIGALVTYGIRSPGVRGINLQPVAFVGRTGAPPGPTRLTLSGVLRRIEQQTAGMLLRDDFVPLPCDTDRVALTFLYRQNGQFIPVTRDADIKRHLPLLENTLMFDAADVLRNTATGLLTGQGLCNCLAFLKDFLPLAPIGLGFKPHEDQARFVTANTFRITVTSFLDRFNFELRAMKKECVHVLTPDGRRIPFSAFNILHRGLGTV